MPFMYARHENHHRFARKVLWLEVAVTNNKSSVIAGYYLRAVRRYGMRFYCGVIIMLIQLGYKDALALYVLIEALRIVGLLTSNLFFGAMELIHWQKRRAFNMANPLVIR